MALQIYLSLLMKLLRRLVKLTIYIVSAKFNKRSTVNLI